MPEKDPVLQEAPKDANERRKEQNELKSGRRGKRNNSADSFYTSYTPDDSDIPAFRLKPAIDKIKISSISVGLLNPISDLLEENGFKKISETIPKKGKYNRNRMFSNGETGIKILYNSRGSDFGGRPLLIEINDPTQEIIDLLNSFCGRFSVLPKISQLEIAFDFLTYDPVLLIDILKKHLFVRYRRGKSFSIKSTSYSGDLRKSSKGTRTYPKNVNVQNVVRLELVLNRRVIKGLRLDISLMPIDKIDFRKYFSFKELELGRIIAYFIRANREEIEKLDNMDGVSGQLLIRTIESWVKTIVFKDTKNENKLIEPIDFYDQKLMKQVDNIKLKEKGIYNYSRFLKNHIVLNQRFQEALAGKTILPIQRKP
jgi:hypothetical protein